MGLAILAALAWFLEDGARAGAFIDAHRLKKDTTAGELVYFLTSIFDGAALAWLCLVYYAAGGSGRRTVRTLLALLLAGVAAALLKEVVTRLRPNTSDLDAFPSGHTAAAMAVAAGLSLDRRRLGVPVILCAAAAVCGVTRVVVGKHFPSDVLGGASIGLFAVLAAGWIPLRSWRGFARREVLAFLLLILPLCALASDRWRDFFGAVAPGIWFVAAALLFRRPPSPEPTT